MTQPLIIKDFDQAIASSPHKGFGLIRNADIEAFDGAIKVKPAVATIFHTSTSTTFTADASTDICTGASFTGNADTTGVAVYLTTTGTLPAGLSTSTVYFVIRVDQNAGTFKLATTITLAEAGTAINITDAGSGSHTIVTVNPSTINHIVYDTRSSFYFLQDSKGRVWFYNGTSTNLLHNSALDTGNNTFTNATGNGLVLFKQNDTASTYYLLAFRNALIDIIDIYSTADLKTPVWSNGWQSLSTGSGTANRHHAIIGQDGIVYFTDKFYVGTLKENSGQTFDPANGATFTYSNASLDTPSDEVLNHLEELGINILAAGNSFNKIYPWDRTSDSFNTPIEVPEKSIKRLKNIGGIIYILAGTLGNIYTTQGSYTRFFTKIPDYLSNNSGTVQSNVVTWGGIASLNGNLLVGANVLTSGNSGVFKIYADGRIIIDQIPSSGAANATSINVQNNFYVFGFANGANYHSTDRYSSFETVIHSAFFRVATKTKKGSFSVLEVVTAKPASSGNIRIGYRTNTSSSFTTIDTFTADGSTTVFQNDSIGLIDIENIQIQIEMDGTIELVEVRFL